MTNRALPPLLLFTLLALASGAPTAIAAPAGASASILDAMGRPVGTAQFTSVAPNAVQVKVTVNGFDPGPGGNHGLHIHAVGRCEAPDFTSAGGHLNLAAKKHGLASPDGSHSGDMPDIQFYPDGSASYSATTTSLTLGALLDADGSAIVIHASPDDGITDPSGSSGARIGCGVIVAEAVTAPGADTAGAPALRSAASPPAPTSSVGDAAATARTRTTASIIDAAGRVVGAATFATAASGAVQVSVSLAGFDPGPGGDHGVHIHAVGKCATPDFASAGGHWNPGAKKHGLANPDGAHAGDMPNVQFLPDGSATYLAEVTGFDLGDLHDSDGSAIVIHAAPDDGITDPSGSSGARIGCGVIVADGMPIR